MSTDIAKIFPIQQIENNYIVNGNGDITAGFKLMLPELFTLSDEEADEYNQQLCDAISVLPEGVTILKQDYHYQDTYKAAFKNSDIISKANDEHNNDRPLLLHYSYIYVTYSNKQLLKTSAYNSFTQFPDYVFKRPFKNVTKKMDEAENYNLRFEIQLKSMKGFKAFRMDDKELYCSLFNYCNLSFDNPITEIGDDILQNYKAENKYFTYGDKVASVISVVKEGSMLPSYEKAKAIPPEIFGKKFKYAPVRKRKASYVYPIGLGLPINHIVNTWIKLVDSHILERQLKWEKRGIGILAMLNVEPAIQKIKDIDTYLKNDLAAQGKKPCVTGVNVVLVEKTEKELLRNVEITKNAFTSLNRTIPLLENEHAIRLFLATCPGNVNENFRTFISTVDESVRYIQKETHYVSDPSGYLVHDPFGNPKLKDTWYSKLLTGNKNELWLGTSGSGKTHNLINFNVQAYLQGEHVIIFENGHSNKSVTKILGGKYFDSAKPDTLRYNIFLCPKNTAGRYVYQYDPKEYDGDEDGVNDKINFIYSMLATIWKKGQSLAPEEQELIKKSISSFYDYINEHRIFPHIKEYFEFLDVFENKILKPRQRKIIDFDRYKLMLEPFVDGRYSYLFDTSENINIVHDRWVVFDLENAWKTDKDLFSYLGLIAIELMLDKERNCLAAKKRYTADEGVDLVTLKETGEHFGALFRKGRKVTTKTIFATQSIKFLESAPELVRDSIMHNSAIIVLFNNDDLKKMYSDLIKYLGITEEEIEVLESITHEDDNSMREYFMKMGSVSAIYRNEQSPIANVIYDSRTETIDKVGKLFEETGHMHTAIKSYVKKYMTLN